MLFVDEWDWAAWAGVSMYKPIGNGNCTGRSRSGMTTKTQGQERGWAMTMHPTLRDETAKDGAPVLFCSGRGRQRQQGQRRQKMFRSMLVNGFSLTRSALPDGPLNPNEWFSCGGT